MNDFTLKPNLLLGVCCTPTQIDGGGDAGSCWNEWAAAGRVRDGSDPAVAADHLARWREDVLLMRKMGVQCCRLGVDWARVEPEEGSFDAAAVARFKEELMLLIGMGIRPLIVLHQCADPQWFTRKGGWEKQDNVRCFLVYVGHIVHAIGHLANEYLTLCEPNAYAFNGWLRGVWPPGKKRMTAATAVLSNLCAAHLRAYRLIHDVRRELGFSDSRVGFALDYKVFVPQSRFNPLHRSAAQQLRRLYQTLPAEAMLTGEFRAPLRSPDHARKGTFADFHAVCYGGRAAVSGFASEGARGDAFRDDLGLEIFPEGALRVCVELLKKRPMNVYLMSGTCDVNDSFRCRFLYDTLKTLGESRLPVKRYYYDSFLDGFRWSDGCYARCGLVGTEGQGMERTVKRSGEFYAKLLRRGGVTEKAFEKYVAEQEYHR